MFNQGNDQVSCGHCYWTGPLDDVAIELVHQGILHRCPSCQELLCLPERLSPCRRSNDRFTPGYDDLAGSPFRSMRIPRD